MRKFLLTSVLALLPVGAIAADLPVRSAAPAPAPVMVAAANWSGFYIGGNVGYAWTDSSFTHLETGGSPTSETFSNSPNGILGGAQIGARYQFQNNLYLGVEAAFSFRNADDQTRTDLASTPRHRLSEVGNIWSLSGNIGYAFGRYIAYAKAGYASTELHYENILISTGAILGQSTKQVGGFVLGAGLEYAFTNNLSLGLEYSYYNFNVGNQQQYNTSGVAVNAINASNDLSSHVATVKLNYRFGGSSAPVVARY